MSTDVGIWLSALMTLGLYSYLVKENAFFRFCEHAYMGLSLAHLAVMGWNNVRDMGIAPLKKGDLLALIPIALGAALFARWSSKTSWLSRYPLAYLVGTASGITVTGVVEAGIIAQVRGAIQPIKDLNSLAALVFTVSAISVCFFILGGDSSKPGASPFSKAVGSAQWLGRLVLMVSFGAVFGSTVMARLGLFIPRLQLLFRDWIHLIQ